jgi:hypothetical protein
MKIMTYQEKFDKISGGKSGLAMNLMEPSTTRTDD